MTKESQKELMDSLTLRFYFHRGQEISKLCVRSRKTQCLLKKQAKNLTNHSCMEIGISTFLETTPDPRTGKVISHGERLRHAVERIVLAYEVGPDVYGVGASPGGLHQFRTCYRPGSCRYPDQASQPDKRRFRVLI